MDRRTHLGRLSHVGLLTRLGAAAVASLTLLAACSSTTTTDNSSDNVNGSATSARPVGSTGTSGPGGTSGTGGTSGPGGAGSTGGPGDSSTTGATRPVDCSGVADDGLAADAVRHLTSGDLDRTYHLARPAGSATTPTAVIFNWHGSGSSADQQVLYSRLPQLGPDRGFAVVTPDGTGKPRGWNMFRRDTGTDDFRFFEDLYAEVGTHVCIDPGRVFSTGISNGSAFTAILACTAPYRFAAIAMVAATVGPLCTDDAPKISALAFHGTADKVVPFGGGTVTASAANGVAAPGAESAIANWATYDGCSGAPVVTDLPEGGTEVTAIRTDHPGCPDGLEVRIYALQGAGHTWPGPIDLAALGMTALGATNRDVDATALMLDFFERHARGS